MSKFNKLKAAFGRLKKQFKSAINILKHTAMVTVFMFVVAGFVTWLPRIVILAFGNLYGFYWFIPTLVFM